jgi:hypothetical protein
MHDMAMRLAGHTGLQAAATHRRLLVIGCLLGWGHGLPLQGAAEDSAQHTAVDGCMWQVPSGLPMVAKTSYVAIQAAPLAGALLGVHHSTLAPAVRGARVADLTCMAG